MSFLNAGSSRLFRHFVHHCVPACLAPLNREGLTVVVLVCKDRFKRAAVLGRVFAGFVARAHFRPELSQECA